MKRVEKGGMDKGRSERREGVNKGRGRGECIMCGGMAWGSEGSEGGTS